MTKTERAETAERRYDAAQRAREFEIELFWKRSLFFWGFQAVSLIAVVAAHSRSPRLAICVSSFGALCAWAWTLANRGSKFWYENWEQKVESTETTVTGPLHSVVEEPRRGFGWLSGHRYSVSRLAIGVSCYAVGFWVAVLGYELLLVWVGAVPEMVGSVMATTFIGASVIYAWVLTLKCSDHEGDAPHGDHYTAIALVITVVCIVVVMLFACLRWPDIKSANVLDLGKCAGGVGTALALVWLIVGNLQQTERFRAALRTSNTQMESTYRASLRPIIVFWSSGGSDWKMLNAGKGTAINVDVFGGDEGDWDRENSVRYSAIPVGKEHEIPLKFLTKHGKLLAQYMWTLSVASFHPNANIRPIHRLRNTITQNSPPNTKSGKLIPTAARYGEINSRSDGSPDCRSTSFRPSTVKENIRAVMNENAGTLSNDY